MYSLNSSGEKTINLVTTFANGVNLCSRVLSHQMSDSLLQEDDELVDVGNCPDLSVRKEYEQAERGILEIDITTTVGEKGPSI